MEYFRLMLSNLNENVSAQPLAGFFLGESTLDKPSLIQSWSNYELLQKKSNFYFTLTPPPILQLQLICSFLNVLNMSRPNF